MTFLILKIAAYLTVALVLGIAAGWVSRHVTAQRETDTTNRALNDNRAKVPQLESLIRVRDNEIQRLKQSQEGQDEGAVQTKQELKEQVALVREKVTEIGRLKAQLESLQALNSDAVDDMSVMIPAEDAVNTPIIDGELEVNSAPSAAHVEQIASLEARIRTLEAELDDAKFEAETAKAETGVRDEMDELTKRLRQKAQEFDRLNRQMEGEKRKVAELERERELQNKSLQVLHQQLEMERSRTAAPASVS